MCGTARPTGSREVLARERLGFANVVALGVFDLAFGEELHRGFVLHELGDYFNTDVVGQFREGRDELAVGLALG